MSPLLNKTIISMRKSDDILIGTNSRLTYLAGQSSFIIYMLKGLVMCKVLNKYKDNVGIADVYIGRPSIWGNPFVIGKDGTRKEVIEMYRVWIQTKPHLLNQLYKLKGKNLVCFCSPYACHGDVLLALANK